MANQIKSVVFTVLLALSVVAAGAGTVSAASDTEVSVTPTNASVDVGDTQTFDIVLDSGANGTQGYNLLVNLTDGSAADIVAADTRGDPGFKNEVVIASDNDSVTIGGGYMSPVSGSEPLRIATVTVEGAAAGTTDIRVNSSSEIRDGNNRKYTVTGYNPATMTVTDPSPDFRVSNLQVPDTVLQGDTLSATATVSNEGSADGTETVAFSVNGSVVASTDVTLAAGDSENVTLSTATNNLRPGMQPVQVAVGGSNVTGQLTVADTDVSLQPTSSTTTVGDTQTYDVVVDRGDDGSQGYNLTVEVSNATVAGITAADTAGNPALADDVSISSANDSVTIEAGYRNARPGARPLTIANVTVEATAEGSTNLELASGSEVRNGTNTPYVIGAYNAAELLVGQSVIVPGSQGPANDPDGDGLFEDVDGNGDTDVFDAIALYNNRNSNAVQSNQQLFDFDGQGDVDVFDAIALYNEVSS